jgi:hypothetical protein
VKKLQEKLSPLIRLRHPYTPIRVSLKLIIYRQESEFQASEHSSSTRSDQSFLTFKLSGGALDTVERDYIRVAFNALHLSIRPFLMTAKAVWSRL